MKQIVWGGYGILCWLYQDVRQNTAVYIDGTRILDNGTRDELRAKYPDAEVFGSDDLFLMPAFVNAHDHGRCIGSLSLGVPDTFLESWLPLLALQPALPKDVAAAYEGIQLLKSGVTATAHSHNPNAWATLAEESHQTIAGYRRVGMRVAYHPTTIDQNRLIYAERAAFLAALPTDLEAVARGMMGDGAPYPVDDYFALCESLYQQYHDADGCTVHVQVSPAGGQWCSDDLILRCAAFAESHRTRIQMHMLETRYQQIYAQKTWGKSFIRHLDEIGALSERLTLAHMVYAEDADFELLSQHRVGIAHNPSSNLRLRSGIAPLAKLYYQDDIALGVGLDGQSLDEDQDYWRELRLALSLGAQAGMTAADLDAHHLLQLGSSGSTRVTFGSEAQLGQLYHHHLADLVLLDWKTAIGFWTPDVNYAVSFPEILLRRANRSHVRHVMAHGEWVIRDGQATKTDEAALEAELREALARVDRAVLRERAAQIQRLLPYVRQFYAVWERL
ncbi:MAG: amidohydrolase family protein [Chloroflexota bacterium]|nr:amidohydrolase family protein [Chloroflexota bacterium]